MDRHYEVVVIGGGIGGLTAAAYLAKAGRKVALFEQHRRLGGCCTSFYRKGFTFDAAVHAIGSCHEGGMFRKILEDLDLWDRVQMRRSNPMDTIITSEFEVPIWIEEDSFLDALREAFPKDIDKLVKMVSILRSFGPQYYDRWAKATYREFLDTFTDNDGARIVFMAPLGNIGLPSYRIGAINGCTLFRENQLLGGYYPKGGFQKLSDAFGKRIRELNGHVFLRTEVKKLDIRDGRVKGVVVGPTKGSGEEHYITCNAVICNASVIHLMEDLVPPEERPVEYVEKLKKMEPSLSSGVLFLGLDTPLQDKFKYEGLHWYVPDPDSRILDGCFEPETIEDTMFTGYGPVYIAPQSIQDPGAAPAGKGTIVGISPAVYKPKDFWRKNKRKLEDAMIDRVAKYIPWVKDYIVWRESATSATVERFTRNYRGAWYGWASIPEQSNLRRLGRKTPFSNLWLAGHWTQPGPGVVQVAKSGQLTAKIVSSFLKKNF